MPLCIRPCRPSRAIEHASSPVGIEAFVRPIPRLLSGDPVKKKLNELLKKLIRDEQGGEVLEYALIAGLIVVAAIAVITSVGGKVLARWQSLNSSM